MADFEIGNLIYLVVLGGVLLGSVLLSRRNEVSKVLKEAGIWVILFVVVIAVVAGWQDIRTAGGQFSSNVTEQGEIIIPQQRDGHYHLTLTINGAAVDFLVDTGASDIVLTQSDAEKIGFDTKQLEYWGTASTANGTVRLAVVRRLFPIDTRTEEGWEHEVLDPFAGGVEVGLGRGCVLEDGLQKRRQVGLFVVEVGDGVAVAPRRVDGREVELLVVGIECGKQIENLIQDIVGPRIGAVDLVDHDD